MSVIERNGVCYKQPDVGGYEGAKPQISWRKDMDPIVVEMLEFVDQVIAPTLESQEPPMKEGEGKNRRILSKL